MAKVKLVLTSIEAQIVELIRKGYSEAQIAKIRRRTTRSHHGNVVRLRNKGIISLGRPGVAGSIKVLIKPNGYTVKPSHPRYTTF